jgi:hypothetical protein
MSEAWKHLDLEGEGLQNANMRLVSMMKRRSTAYRWLALFPLGIHRSYLEDRRMAWVYRAATLLALVLFIARIPLGGAAVLLGLAAFALYDIRWIDDRVATINKRLRMQVYMRHGAGAPKGFTGRYRDDGLEEYLQTKERERGGHQPANNPGEAQTRSRAPSFAEQEAMLKELAKGKNRKE